MIVKVSFVIAASVVACAISQKLNNISCKNHTTIVNVQDGASLEEIHKIEDDHTSSQIQEEEEEEKEEANLVSTKNLSQKCDLEREFEERKVNVEGKLLELYGLNEERSCLANLQKEFDEKSKEIVLLSDTIASMRAEKKKWLLSDEVKQSVLAAKKLELAKKKIAQLERVTHENARFLKDRVSMIEEKFGGLRGNYDGGGDGLGEREEDDIETKIEEGAFGVEFEVGLRRRINKQLELEKRELTVKLLGAQERIASLSQLTEEKVMLKIEEEISELKHRNEELTREMETLQSERFEMVEELVYQRWLNICLKLEKQNKYCPQSDTSKSNPRSDPPSSSYSSSLSFSSTESDQTDTRTLGSSSSTSGQNNSKKSFSFLKRLITKWGCKDNSIVFDPVAQKRTNFTANNGKVRRHSTSTVLDRNSSSTRNNGNNGVTSKNPIVDKKKLEPRARRVSFNDLVKTRYDMPSSFRQRGVEKPCYNATIRVEGQETSEKKLETPIFSGDGSIKRTRIDNNNNNIVNEVECIESEISKSSKGNKVEEEDQMMQPIFNMLFVFLLLIFFACFMY